MQQRKVKIVYVSNAIIPSRQANSVHIMKMCAALAANGHDVSLIYPDSLSLEENISGSLFDFYGVPASFKTVKLNPYPLRLTSGRLFLYPMLIFRKLIYPFMASRKVDDLVPDIVISRFLPGIFWMRKGIPLVYENHNYFREFGFFSSVLFRKLIKRPSFKRLVVISRPLLDDYLQCFPGLDGKAILAPDGADEIREFRRVSLQGGFTFNAGYTGHLYKGRGVEIIVEAARKIPDVGFHIIGGSGPDIAQWKAACSDLENLFFYGFVPPREIKNYLCSMDVLLAPYQKYTGTAAGVNTSDRMSPLKIFEYMAAGKPIIASDLPVLHEVIVPDKTALLCEAGAAAEWAEAILRLKGNPSMAAALGNNAKKVLLENYTWARRAGKILDGIQA